MNTEKQQPKQYLPEDEQRQDGVREEAVAYAKPEFLFAQYEKKTSPCQYTLEELECLLAKAEKSADINSEEVHARIRQKYPQLCM